MYEKGLQIFLSSIILFFLPEFLVPLIAILGAIVGVFYIQRSLSNSNQKIIKRGGIFYVKLPINSMFVDFHDYFRATNYHDSVLYLGLTGSNPYISHSFLKTDEYYYMFYCKHSLSDSDFISILNGFVNNFKFWRVDPDTFELNSSVGKIFFSESAAITYQQNLKEIQGVK